MDCRALGFVLAVGLAAAPLHAQPVEHSLTDGHQLADSCRSSASTVRAMCLGYLAAVADDTRHHQRERDSRPIACLPSDTSLELYREAWLAFAAAQPDILAHKALAGVKAALAARWPCP